MPYKSEAQRKFMHARHPEIAARWDKEYPHQGKLPKHVKKKKTKISVNNKLKGAFGQMNPETNHIQINLKAHKKKGKLDVAELASTIKHEMTHVKYPNMTEKEVYKRTAKTKIAPQEQYKLIAKLRMKKINYKIGAVKRKLKMKLDDKMEPGSLINKSKELSKKQIAVMGMM